MDKRIFGLRNQYSVVFSAGGQRQLSPEEVGRRLFGPVVSGGQVSSVLLRNGARLHLDVVSYPEYATPVISRLLNIDRTKDAVCRYAVKVIQRGAWFARVRWWPGMRPPTASRAGDQRAHCEH